MGILFTLTLAAGLIPNTVKIPEMKGNLGLVGGPDLHGCSCCFFKKHRCFLILGIDPMPEKICLYRQLELRIFLWLKESSFSKGVLNGHHSLF